MSKLSHALILLGALAPLWGEHGQASAFSDPFDGPLSPAWAVRADNGSVAIDDHTFAPNRVVEFRSRPGGQREMVLTHDFGAPLRGTVRVRFYDRQPGAETLYQGIRLHEIAHPERVAALGVQDFDADYYCAMVDGAGPAAACGRYPQITTTAVARSAGWHDFELTIASDGVAMAIDGRAVFAAAGEPAYDRLQLYVSGPYWRPDTVGWFDDVRYDPSDEPAEPRGIAVLEQAIDRHPREETVVRSAGEPEAAEPRGRHGGSAVRWTFSEK